MPRHPLTNYEIQKYYTNEPRFNGTYSRDDLPSKIKDGAYVINLDEYSDIGTDRIAGLEHIPIEIKRFIGNESIKTNIFRIQAYGSIMCGYFCIGIINFMPEGKSLPEYTNLFSPYDFKKNDD